MGTGDWNDGMNRVGVEGHGESVWLGIFLADDARPPGRGRRRARRFGEGRDLPRRRPKRALAAVEAAGMGRRVVSPRLLRRRHGPRLGLERRMPDRRDPPGLGRRSPGPTPTRCEKAMAAVDERLVRRDSRIVLLLDPPFDAGTLQPGYIKGYVPGVRENGGQYSHAAAWVAWAFARLGRGAKAHEVYDLLNPIRHGDTPEAAARYKVEPYVLAGDVYGRGDTRGPVRLDLVHRLRRLDVPRRPGRDPRLPQAGQPAADRALHPAELGSIRDLLPPRSRQRTRSPSRTPTASTEGCDPSSWTGKPSNPRPGSRLATTAASTRSGSSWADRGRHLRLAPLFHLKGHRQVPLGCVCSPSEQPTCAP